MKKALWLASVAGLVVAAWATMGAGEVGTVRMGTEAYSVEGAVEQSDQLARRRGGSYGSSSGRSRGSHGHYGSSGGRQRRGRGSHGSHG